MNLKILIYFYKVYEKNNLFKGLYEAAVSGSDNAPYVKKVLKKYASGAVAD